jgi:hypothetical protein
MGGRGVGKGGGGGGGGAMFRLVFGSETVEFLLPNAPERCRAGGKIHECSTGRDELVECVKLWIPSVSAINRDVTCRTSLIILSTAVLFHRFDLLWADHCVRRPSLNLFPLETVCVI